MFNLLNYFVGLFPNIKVAPFYFTQPFHKLALND